MPEQTDDLRDGSREPQETATRDRMLYPVLVTTDLTQTRQPVEARQLRHVEAVLEALGRVREPELTNVVANAHGLAGLMRTPAEIPEIAMAGPTIGDLQASLATRGNGGYDLNQLLPMVEKPGCRSDRHKKTDPKSITRTRKIKWRDWRKGLWTAKTLRDAARSTGTAVRSGWPTWCANVWKGVTAIDCRLATGGPTDGTKLGELDG